jgi:hypothetical protein
MNDFETEAAKISQKLDRIELEIAMNQEALESIEMRLRLLNAELDFEIENP